MKTNILFFDSMPRRVSCINFIPNRCGSLEGWAKYFYKLIPDLIFKDACNNHDREYFIGGWIQEHKDKADARFLLAMFQRIERENYEFKWALKGFYKWAASKYFSAVVLAGADSFNMFRNEKEFLEHCLKNAAAIENKFGTYENILIE